MTLAAIIDRLKALAAASPLLASRPVLIEDKGNLVNDLENALSTQSLAVVVALASGQVKDGSPVGRGAWTETLEVVIHRGSLDGVDVPSTISVLEDLRARIQGAYCDAAKPAAGSFTCARHDLREGGDGTYARVLTVTAINTVTSTP